MQVAVVGAGVIGRSIAWQAAAAGHQVVLIDPHPASGASWVAGGMLAPYSEAWLGEQALLELGEASLARWPDFAAALRAAGQDPGLRADGTVVAAIDSADRQELSTVADYLSSLGREATWRSGRELRALEPALGPAVRGGLSIDGDLAVDNRRALEALRNAGERTGVRVLRATATAVTAGRVMLADHPEVCCEVAVIAAGARSGSLHPALREAIRPVKGEILRLRARAGVLPPPVRTVRALVAGTPVYLVPRDGGRLVLGATQVEAGFDPDVTVEAVRDLLAAALRVVPSLGYYAIEESCAGHRPGSPDNLPLVGWLEPGVLVATGHHRNGFLLAPITAEAVLTLIAGAELPAPVRAADPARLVPTTPRSPVPAR